MRRVNKTQKGHNSAHTECMNVEWLGNKVRMRRSVMFSPGWPGDETKVLVFLQSITPYEVHTRYSLVMNGKGTRKPDGQAVGDLRAA